jgi:hypothetical protein
MGLKAIFAARGLRGDARASREVGKVRHMRARLVVIALCLAAAFSLPARAAAPDDKELTKDTKALAALVADSLAEVEVGKPIHVTFGPLEPDGTPNGALVPFVVSGRHATNDVAEYVAYFHEMPAADDYERNLLKSRKLSAKRYMLIDFREVGARGWEQVDWPTAKAEGSKLVVKTATWKGSDPACCPTGEGSLAITLDEDLRLKVDGAASRQ